MAVIEYSIDWRNRHGCGATGYGSSDFGKAVGNDGNGVFALLEPGPGFKVDSLKPEGQKIEKEFRDAVQKRTGSYPFLPLVALVWLPATAWLVWTARRGGALWTAAAGFAISIFLLVWLGRVFHGSYLVWPLAGIVAAGLLAAAPDPRDQPADSTGSGAR